MRSKNEPFLEATTLASLEGKKGSKKEKEAKKLAEKTRKKSRVKLTKSLGGSSAISASNSVDDGGSTEAGEPQPERKTRSLGEMLTPLTANFISYSTPNTPQPQKKLSNDEGSVNGDAPETGSNGSSTPRLTATRPQRSVSRVRRVPISTRTSGVSRPTEDLLRVTNGGPDAVDMAKEEVSLEDEAISIRSNNSEYSCSDDNAPHDLSDDGVHPHHMQHQRGLARGGAVSPVQSSCSHNSSSSRLYLDFHLQRNKIQSLSMRKTSYASADSNSVADESLEDGHNNNEGGEEAMRRLMAENRALRKQLEQLQANQISQAHNYSIFGDLSLKQTTV